MPQQITLQLTQVEPPQRARDFIEAGLNAARGIDWFDFVASDYEAVYTVLAALERGRLCEWGSGTGVVTGLAAMLGYRALGIEIHEPLVTASKILLEQFDLPAAIEQGDYFERADQADVYFTYCWPGKAAQTEERFREIAPAGARLILYYGPADIRWVVR